MTVYILKLLLAVCTIFICGESSDNYQNQTCTFELETQLTKSNRIMQKHNSTTMIAYLNENNNIEQTRTYIHKYYLSTFNLYYSLYENIKDEHFWDSSCKLRWPIGWYLAHAASFYNNKLKMNNHLTHTINSIMYDEFDHLFAQGTDEMNWTDFVPQYPKTYWPSVQNVRMYVKDTRDIIVDFILTTPLISLPITKQSTIWWTILMGIEHERIHLETSAMLIRQLPLHKCKSEINEIWSNEYPLLNSNNISPINELISVKGKEITYGRGSQLLSSNNDFFGWDTEYGEYTVNVSDFNASKYMVSNSEYYEFVEDNGYLMPEYWSYNGWKWVIQTNTTHPKFWIMNSSNKSDIKLRNLFSEIDMFYAWNRPVITNHYESIAFLKWKSEKLNKNLRLITEDEWYLLRTLDDNNGNKNIREMDTVNGNVNFAYFTTECAVNIFEFGNSNFYDIIGNVHHHTQSNYHPFNNYEIDPLYVDFSSPFFNHSYFLMKGGSYLSSGNMAMIYNRCQWFREHYFQASGIRYVESNIDINIINNNKKTTKEYFENSDESDELCNECIHFHFSDLQRDNYRQIISEIINENIIFNNDINILDIGCSVGGVIYELAKNYECIENIIGIDDRARFIGIANQMQQNKKLEYFMKNDYGQSKCYSVSLNELGMQNITNKIRFIHDIDLGNIESFETKFDLIIGENMFERYYHSLCNKKGILANILNENGTIILFEDYQWNKNGNDKNDIMGEINCALGNKLKLRKSFDTKPIIKQNYESSRMMQQYSLHCTIWN
eukprot:82869_1